MRQMTTRALVFLFLLGAATTASAQSLGTIAGAVKDTSGAVLPGVTVEVASSALIEKTRTAVTDGAGQYAIVNLPVGTYSVTFSLPGFDTVRREGIVFAARGLAVTRVTPFAMGRLLARMACGARTGHAHGRHGVIR